MRSDAGVGRGSGLEINGLRRRIFGGGRLDKLRKLVEVVSLITDIVESLQNKNLP
jgi:hypothetical protein